jgi:cholesterol oxidase
MDDETHMEPVRFTRGSDVMLLLGTLLTDGGGRVPRPLRWLGQALRHPGRLLFVTRPWGKAERSTILLVMQTRGSEMRLVHQRPWFFPFRRFLTTVPEPGFARIPSYLPIANQVARELGADLDAEPQSALNEAILDIPTTAHILGGCAIGASPETGVVDDSCRVFGQKGLYVMDGSVIGANLGVNPSLTITALAERACSRFPPFSPADAGRSAAPSGHS